MKRVVSVSLGSARRDKRSRVQIFGEEFQIERIGTGGDLSKFGETIRSLDGQVDAIGIGGADIYVVIGERRYAFRQIKRAAEGVKETPVSDGSLLKHTLERQAILRLHETGELDLSDRRVLLVSAVDRFGMAQALALKSKSVVYGDLLFGLGLPVPIRSYPAVETLGRLLLPVVTRLPFKWFYPTGDKQDMRTPKHLAEFEKADVICGDWHYIRRFAPDRLEGKIVITQTLRHADLDLLKQMGVKTAIATTPIIDGESFATNVMEGVVLTLMQKRPEEVEHEELVQMLDRLKWKPNVMSLGSGSLT